MKATENDNLGQNKRQVRDPTRGAGFGAGGMIRKWCGDRAAKSTGVEFALSI